MILEKWLKNFQDNLFSDWLSSVLNLKKSKVLKNGKG
jgi:hypothetical protein